MSDLEEKFPGPHIGERVYVRLRDEHDYSGAAVTARNYFYSVRKRHSHPKKVFIPQSHPDVGMILMTMGLGHIPFAAKVVGANEHESHYVFPMMIQNNHIIDPGIISTDTAGTNNINDLLYYVAGKIHAPCNRSIFDKAGKICGFKPLSKYKGSLIKPGSTVNKRKIREQWPEILPILYSLFSHDSNQEKIVQQLSSHDFNSDIT